MLVSEMEDAVLAASPDTEEELFEETKSQAGYRDNGVGIRGVGHTNVSSIFWAQRVLHTHGTGAWVFGFPTTQVWADSQVSVTMTELDVNGIPFFGRATMQVRNVVPHADGTMTVRYHVGWDANLRVLFNFIIVN
ncbi:hypothetical protein ACFU44_28100 [Nocardia rhizosphaerihabitans]|uniref:hypothetical protein n=1 Tax=Nocardia rhizosphaerihabitans TaxID=1691570 RepID=UPI00366BECBA